MAPTGNDQTPQTFLIRESRPTPRVLIVVEGGVVQDVISTGPVDYLIKDFDHIDNGDTFDPDGFCAATFYSESEFVDECCADTSSDPEASP